MSETVFQQQSLINASPHEVFAWHERDGCFLRLSPPWESVRVIRQTGSLTNGAEVLVQVKLAPGIWSTWHMRHEGYRKGEQFQDRMMSGPFPQWLHTHRMDSPPDQPGVCELTDHIAYRLPFGLIGRIFGASFSQAKLARMFAYRHAVTQRDLQCYVRYSKGEPPMKILVSGATGLVGGSLVPFLTTQGHEVHRLVRRSTQGERDIVWNPESGELDASKLEGFDAVIHLAGENIAAGRWTSAQKEKIKTSRTKGTQLLADTLAKLNAPPKTFICASAIGYYGNRGDVLLDETATPADDYLGQVCQAWESATQPAKVKGIRVVNLRIGVVLSPKGGALAKMLPPFLFGAGGIMGNGKQYMSWVTLDDIQGAILHVLNTPSVDGPVNMVAPQAVRNSEFTSTLGKVLFRPTIAPVPGFAVKLLFGEMGEALLLSSTRVKPGKLEASGYDFAYPSLEGALRHVLGKR